MTSRILLSSMLLVTLVGCDDKSTDTDPVTLADADGDGFSSLDAGGLDCDDNNASVFPTAEEICNGEDDDCDGEIDDEPADGETFYPDADGDGYGSDAAAEVACDQPDGYAPVSTDCDDSAATVFPDAAEFCDGLDTDCDGDSGDVGLASFTSNGVWTDLTAELSGTASSPAALTLSESGTLNLCAGTWYSHLTIEADIDVIGSGAADTVLSGGDLDTVVRVETAGLTVGLSGLTVTGGLGTTLVDKLTHGGGLLCSATSDVILSDLVFTANSADIGGGAALLGDCSADLSAVSFTDNDATEDAGAIYSLGMLDIIDSTFSSNTSGDHAGGIYFYGGIGTISDSAFSDNHAGAGGGAVYVNGANVGIAGVSFSGDTSDAHAGAIDAYSAELSILECDFSDLTASNSGGALYVSESTVDITSATFDSITATNYYGGAIYLTGSEVTMSDATLSDNSANYGGAIMLYSTSTLDISDSTFDSNTADSAGGGMYLFTEVEVTGSSITFIDNDPDDLYISGEGAETLGKKADFTCTDDGC